MGGCPTRATPARLQCSLFKSSLSRWSRSESSHTRGHMDVSSQRAQLSPGFHVFSTEVPDTTKQRRHRHCALCKSLTHRPVTTETWWRFDTTERSRGVFHMSKNGKPWFVFNFLPLFKNLLYGWRLNQNPSENHTLFVADISIQLFQSMGLSSFFLFYAIVKKRSHLSYRISHILVQLMYQSA